MALMVLIFFHQKIIYQTLAGGDFQLSLKVQRDQVYFNGIKLKLKCCECARLMLFFALA